MALCDSGLKDGLVRGVIMTRVCMIVDFYYNLTVLNLCDCELICCNFITDSGSGWVLFLFRFYLFGFYLLGCYFPEFLFSFLLS